MMLKSDRYEWKRIMNRKEYQLIINSCLLPFPEMNNEKDGNKWERN